MDKVFITALLSATISVFSGIGVATMFGVVIGTNTVNKRAAMICYGILTCVLALNACMWLVFNGSLK